MTKTMTAAVLVIALGLGACSKKKEPTITPLPPEPIENSNSTDPDSLNMTELPALQADMVARAGADTIYFATDSYDLDPSARATLAAQARWLIANPRVRARLEGHADERGTREYNLALGERRANAVRDFRVAQGVPASRLSVTSWGKERPVAMGSTEEAWARNRRQVTLVVR